METNQTSVSDIKKRRSFSQNSAMVSVVSDKVSLSLFFLAKKTNIDVRILLYMYENFGDQIIYLFFLLSDHVIEFPSFDVVEKCLVSGSDLDAKLKSKDDFDPVNVVEALVKSLYKEKTKSLVFEIPLSEKDSFI